GRDRRARRGGCVEHLDRVVGAARRARADLDLRPRLRALRPARALRAPCVEGRPGREVVAQLLQAVLDLGADGEGAMTTVRASRKRLLLVAPNARHTSATCVGVRQLLLDRLLETGLPPGSRR